MHSVISREACIVIERISSYSEEPLPVILKGHIIQNQRTLHTSPTRKNQPHQTPFPIHALSILTSFLSCPSLTSTSFPPSPQPKSKNPNSNNKPNSPSQPHKSPLQPPTCPLPSHRHNTPAALAGNTSPPAVGTPLLHRNNRLAGHNIPPAVLRTPAAGGTPFDPAGCRRCIVSRRRRCSILEAVAVGGVGLRWEGRDRRLCGRGRGRRVGGIWLTLVFYGMGMGMCVGGICLSWLWWEERRGGMFVCLFVLDGDVGA